MRTKKKYRRVRAAPVAEYNYGGGVCVRCYADWPPESKLGKVVRRWRRETSKQGTRVTISSGRKTYEGGRCPRCGCVTKGSGQELRGGPDNGDLERGYCPRCLPIILEEEKPIENIPTLPGLQ